MIKWDKGGGLIQRKGSVIIITETRTTVLAGSAGGRAVTEQAYRPER